MRHEPGRVPEYDGAPLTRAARLGDSVSASIFTPISTPISTGTMTTMTAKTSRRAAEVM